MKRQVSQYDTGRLTEAVATPTCSSCCCCCCCLTTAFTSSTLLTQRIARETRGKNIKSRGSLLIASALYVPLSIAVGYFGFWTINLLLEECTTRTYTTSYSSARTYEVCTNPAANFIWPVIILAPFLVLSYLYMRAKIPHPWRRSLFATALIGIATAVEFVGGAFLILSTGGLLYIVLIPFFYGLLYKVYNSTSLSKPLNG